MGDANGRGTPEEAGLSTIPRVVAGTGSTAAFVVLVEGEGEVGLGAPGAGAPPSGQKVINKLTSLD